MPDLRMLQEFLAEPHVASLSVADAGRGPLPPEQAAAYVEMAEADHGEQVVIFLRPERWLSADLG